MTVTLDDLQSRVVVGSPAGIEHIEIEGPAPIVGTVCRIDLRMYEFQVFCFRDLINKSLHPDSADGCFPAESLSLGCSVPDFVQGNHYACQGLRMYPQWQPPYGDIWSRCVIASNTLQTNFIRSNGFVIENGRVVAKPLHAWGRDDPEYGSRGIAGDYSCLLVEGANARVVGIRIDDAAGTSTSPILLPGCCGIASPRLVEQTATGPRVVEIEQRPAPFRDGPSCRLNGNCVDWDPNSTATSFTAFGVAQNEQGEDTILVMASIFAGQWGTHTDDHPGILPAALGQVLIRDGKVHEAIIGGGGADTQQYVRWRDPQIRVGPVRSKSLDALRGEVDGIRGLGAIAAILPR